MPCTYCSKGSYCPPNAAVFDIERKVVDDDASKSGRFEGVKSFISLSSAVTVNTSGAFSPWRRI